MLGFWFVIIGISGCLGFSSWLFRDVEVSGSYAYVGDLKSLRVIDISNPSEPREIAALKTPSYIEAVSVVGLTA